MSKLIKLQISVQVISWENYDNTYEVPDGFDADDLTAVDLVYKGRIGRLVDAEMINVEPGSAELTGQYKIFKIIEDDNNEYKTLK
jgi:hypothetical protein